jgi:putative oxidoreductase
MLWAMRHVLRIALGAVFIWAAITKASDVKTFIEEVGRYRLLPEALTPAFAVCLIGIEFIASVMLLTGIRLQIAACTIALLLTIFIIALSQALLRHLDLSCGCFGGEDPASWWTVGRDFVMLVACLALMKFNFSQNALLLQKRSAKAEI